MAIPLVPILIAAVAAFALGRKSAMPNFIIRPDDPRSPFHDGRVAFSPAVATRIAKAMKNWGLSSVPASDSFNVVSALPNQPGVESAYTAAMAAHAAGLDVWVSTDAVPLPPRPGSRVIAFVPAGFIPDDTSSTVAASTILEAEQSIKKGGSLLVLLAAAGEPFPAFGDGPATVPGGPATPPPAGSPPAPLPGQPGGPGLGAGPADGLDPNMPPAVRSATLALLNQGTDPQVLLAAANVADASGFPIAAKLLRAKAASLPGAGFTQSSTPTAGGGGAVPGTPEAGGAATPEQIAAGVAAVQAIAQQFGAKGQLPTPEQTIGLDG
jgi:hypothetical protein